MRRRLPEPEQPRPPRDSDYEQNPHVPVLWGSPVERCKRELFQLFSDGPIEERKFHHAMMRQGWGGAEVTSARAALGVREGSTLFLPKSRARQDARLTRADDCGNREIEFRAIAPVNRDKAAPNCFWFRGSQSFLATRAYAWSPIEGSSKRRILCRAAYSANCVAVRAVRVAIAAEHRGIA